MTRRLAPGKEPMPEFEGRLLNIRLVNEYQRGIKASMALSDYGLRGRSRWIREALGQLHSLVADHPYELGVSVRNYFDSPAGKTIQVCLDESAAETLGKLMRIAREKGVKKDGLITAIVTMAVHNRLFSEGL